MNKKIYQLFSNFKKGLFALALATFTGGAFAQSTYTFNYTGSIQTLTVPAGSYSVSAWGGDGGWHANDPNLLRGKGGYASGTITVTSPTTLYIAVGGAGGIQTNSTVPGGWNGGGPAKYYSYSYNGGGGASHIATATGVLSSLVTNTPAVLIVAGGGGGGATSQTPGYGGGVNGGNSTRAGCTGGTQTTPGSSSIAGGNAVFGQGWDGTPTGGSYGAGGGGWYGGGCESGGSGYIGGVTNGVTSSTTQVGFVVKPIVPADGLIIITELCSMSLYASGSNSLSPMICSGQSLTLLTNAISNYSWSTGATTSSLIVSPTTNTVYVLTAVSPSNCTTSRSISVSVNSGVPVLSISNPSNNICLGKTVSLTATGALTYTWTNPGVVNGQTFTPSSTAVYTVAGQNGCGTTISTTTITVAPLPVSVLASPTIVCQGYTATLSSTATVSGYTWQPGPLTGSIVTVAPTANTIYTVTASDGICAGTQTLLLTTKITPTISTSQTVATICMGQSLTLSASGAGIGGTYLWTPGGAGGSINLAPSTSTSVVVAGTNSLNCTSTAIQIILVNQPPPLVVSANKMVVCTGDPVILTASGAPIYQWVNGPSTANYTVNPTTATTVYTVTGSQSTNTCTIDAMITITAIIPNVTITSSVAVCNGGNAVIVATGASSYKFNGINMGSNGTYTSTPVSSGIYTLVATTTSFNTNCVTTKFATVTVNPNPTITVTPGKTTICKGETHTLTASGASTYSWSSPAATGSVITVKPTLTTIYTVTGVDANGCIGEILYTAKVSPCTGINDVTELQGLAVYPNPSTGEFIVTATSDIALKIFNGIGQEVRSFTLDTTNEHKAQVKDLSNGVYFIVGENAEGKVNQKIIITK